MNWNIKNKKKTIEWTEMSDDEKREYLDEDLRQYYS